MNSKAVDQESADLAGLPPLPAGWTWCIPFECCSVIASGSTPKPDLMYTGTGDVPFIKVYNLTDRGVLDFSVKPTFVDRLTHVGLLARSRVLPEDVLINIVGPPLGKVAIVPKDYPEWNINQAVVLFRPQHGILNKYLVFAFLTDSIMRRVTSLAKATAGQFNIGVGMCRRLLPIPLAPTNEQRRIVEKIEELFSDLDAGVAALERAKANLKRYRASVLKSAVEGSLTAEWRAKHPNVEPASKLLDRILKERRRKWEVGQLDKFAAAGKQPPPNWQSKYVKPLSPDATHLRELPEGWVIASVDQSMTTITSGSRDWSQFYGRGSGTFIMAQNVRQGYFDRSYRQPVDPPENDRDRERSQVRYGDLLVTIVGANTGDVCRIPSDLPEYYVCQSVALMRPVESGISRFAEFYFVADHGGQMHFKRYIYGQGRPHLSFDQIKMTPVVLPPLAEQAEIIVELEEKLSQIQAADIAIDHGLRRADRLRQSILKRAFEGKLVPQNPSDEPANVLLERITHQKPAEPTKHSFNGKRSPNSHSGRSKMV